MQINSATSKLDQIRVDIIRPNPDNPRITFRQRELDELQESIRRYGVQVPIAVFRDGSHYVLLDGERRWRCASKLNHKTIPALVQNAPTALENMLLMFNIHSLREQWDLLTIAMKLPTVIELLADELHSQPTEAELSNRTGLARGVIRRCKLLIDLPARYKTLLLRELKKPKNAQRLSEDFFIEMERALTTVVRAMPNVVPEKNAARDALLDKYRRDVFVNIVDLRKIAKIGRAATVGADPEAAARAIKRLISDPSYSIDDAFASTVSESYVERDIVTRIESLIARLNSISAESVDQKLRERLEELVRRAQTILGAG